MGSLQAAEDWSERLSSSGSERSAERARLCGQKSAMAYPLATAFAAFGVSLSRKMYEACLLSHMNRITDTLLQVVTLLSAWRWLTVWFKKLDQDCGFRTSGLGLDNPLSIEKVWTLPTDSALQRLALNCSTPLLHFVLNAFWAGCCTFSSF